MHGKGKEPKLANGAPSKAMRMSPRASTADAGDVGSTRRTYTPFWPGCDGREGWEGVVGGLIWRWAGRQPADERAVAGPPDNLSPPTPSSLAFMPRARRM